MSWFSRFTAAAAAAALVLSASACPERGNGESGAGSRVSVVAGFYPLAEAAQRVGGPRVAVRNLTPVGTEPHDLELSSDQVEQVRDADLVIVLGRGFQPAVERAARRRTGPTLEVMDALAVPSDDPHVWLDPVLMRRLVDEVATALAGVDPNGQASYRSGAEAYRARIAELETRYWSGLARCARRLIVTSHAAFGHLAGRFGLQQRGVTGISPEVEPDPRTLAELVDLVRREGVTTVFTEPLVSPRVAQTLAREAGVRTDVLDPVEGLTRAQRASGQDYISVMDTNLERLQAALDCS